MLSGIKLVNPFEHLCCKTNTVILKAEKLVVGNLFFRFGLNAIRVEPHVLCDVLRVQFPLL
jgi:hypothetical protein